MQLPIRSADLVWTLTVIAAGTAVGCLNDAPTEQPSGSAPFFGSGGSATMSTWGAGGGAGAGAAATLGGAGGASPGASGAGGGTLSTAGVGPIAGAGGAGISAGAGGGGAGGEGAVGPSVDPRGTMVCDATALSLGEMHLLTNEWTDPLADTCAFLDMAGNFGWKWTRGATGMGDHPNYPNYPELEFGINPWNKAGLDKSTTTLLPMQLKDITSASMTVDVFTDVGANNTGWNLAFELWLADKNPALGAANPKGEIMVFLSNWPGYYPANPETQQTLNDGIHDYKLYVSSDSWGTWGYYRQYRLDTHDGKFSGKLDIAKFLKHYVQDEHWDANLWLTRFELGNEVYQNSAGTTTIKAVSFEVNGQVRDAKTQ